MAEKNNNQGYVPESITKREEEVIRKIMRQAARQECEESVRDFIECARGRTVSVAWKCRAENKKMSKCLIHHTREEELEKRKQQYWEEKMKRTPLTIFPPELEQDIEQDILSIKHAKRTA